VTSGVLWLATTVALTAAISGIAWANSAKARARQPGQGARLYRAIFLFVAPWTIGIAAISVFARVLDLSFLAEFLVIVGGFSAVFVTLELLFKPIRTLHDAYTSARPQEGVQ